MRCTKKNVAIFFQKVDRLKQFIVSQLSTSSLNVFKLHLKFIQTGFDRYKRCQTMIEDLDVGKI